MWCLDALVLYVIYSGHCNCVAQTAQMMLLVLMFTFVNSRPSRPVTYDQNGGGIVVFAVWNVYMHDRPLHYM